MQQHRRAATAAAVAVLVATGLAACGGGGGSSAGGGSAGPVLSGQSYKGPTAGATVCVWRIDDAQADRRGAAVPAQAGSAPALQGNCVVTRNDGSYSLVLPAGTSGDLLLDATGGTYCSNEAVYDGSACPGGGTSIALGSARLRTVVQAGGASVSAPLTLLTTAAVTRAGAPLSWASFGTAYAAVATGVGVGSSPTADPASGALATLLARLTAYVGGDAATVAGTADSLAAGQLTASGGVLQSSQAFQCTAVQQADVTATTNGLVRCLDLPDGSSRYTFHYFSWDALFTGGTSTDAYAQQSNLGTCAAPGPWVGDYVDTPLTVTLGGVQTLSLQASADPARGQSGTANQLSFTYTASPALGIAATRTDAALYCRSTAATPASAGLFGAVPFTGFLSQAGSPPVGGYPSRIDPATSWSAMPN